MPPEEQTSPIDFRHYIGIIFFRWHIIAVCFLYCLLAGVLYVQFAPKQYKARCKVTLYRDPVLTINQPHERNPFWTSFQLHEYMLTNPRTIQRVVDLLTDDWGDRFGNVRAMAYPVEVTRQRGVQRLITVSAKGSDRAYARAYLETLIEEHRAEWENLQRQSRKSAGEMLEAELARLEDDIRAAEEDLLEYQRLHDIARVEARSTMESRYLEALMERKNQISTELMMLEAQYPMLKEAGATLIRDVNRLTRETGAVEAVEDEGDEASGEPEEKPELPPDLQDVGGSGESGGWADLKTRVARLELREQQLARDLMPGNPKLVTVRKDLQQARDELQLATDIEMARLEDRHRALQIQLDAIETAEYQWQSKNLLAAQRRAEYKRIQGTVERFEENYGTLYSRLHDMRVAEELKAERFIISEPPAVGDDPVWPDPTKILLAALAAGLGSGFGLALLVQLMDNRVQSIQDVEEDLKVPYLGGVPYWVHSGLETTIRPIVTEEHSAGAVEAYRALRTSILSAMERMHEKILLVTSADAREGKTLTTLNLAIMIAHMDKRVLLVDMDLRRGRLHRSLGVDRSPGMTDALLKTVSLREVISGTRFENLDLAPTGSSIDNSAEQLQSSGIRAMFDEVADDYDYILVDTSPVLRVTDTVILATQGVGVLLYVARVNHTPKPLIKYSLNMLADARVLGLVMNSIEMHKISSLYYTYQYPNYAYYSNAYAYGYNYYYYGDVDNKTRRLGAFSWRRRAMLDWLRKTFFPTE